MATDEADDLLRKAEVVPYGVLGSQLGARGVTMRGSDPAKSEGPPIVIVDPAGLHHVQPPGGPCGAGGAAGVIYSWLGIGDDESFPNPVIASVRSTGDAKLHMYSNQHLVIHAVGPDLRVEDCDAKGAVARLSRAYSNILRQLRRRDSLTEQCCGAAGIGGHLLGGIPTQAAHPDVSGAAEGPARGPGLRAGGPRGAAGSEMQGRDVHLHGGRVCALRAGSADGRRWL